LAAARVGLIKTSFRLSRRDVAPSTRQGFCDFEQPRRRKPGISLRAICAGAASIKQRVRAE
jgi:hypothetical protein